MSVTKLQRNKKRQMGQFLTPINLASEIVQTLPLTKETRILEPSMGDGSFIIPLIERFLPLHTGSTQKRLEAILGKNIWGVEIDEELYARCLNNIRERWGSLPKQHNLIRADFFASILPAGFDIIVGNPPFGGSFDSLIEDALDAMFGLRNGEKIKKETYAFFIVKSTDILKPRGKLVFICSDTFLTINTMRGLRSYLMDRGDVAINHLAGFSDETTHPMVVLHYSHTGFPGKVAVDDIVISRESIRKTGNLSFGMKPEFEKYFAGPRMGDLFIATSGMTTGKNEYFVREIQDGYIDEPYEFSFHSQVISLADEQKKARLGKLSPKTIAEIQRLEKEEASHRAVLVKRRDRVQRIQLPDSRYCFYNKAINSIVYAPPTHVIYWEDDGDAVLTYKKNGNWYLRGVGGQPYFLREGLTWQLIASRIHMRHLPPGYILDSGAPCAFPREGTAKDEIFFALGWALTNQCNKILKEVINHTKNIQGKDFERIPYPFWVSSRDKRSVVELIKRMITDAKGGKKFTYKSDELVILESLFAFREVDFPVAFVEPRHTWLCLF